MRIMMRLRAWRPELGLILLGAALLITLLTSSRIWERGGYADDFAFLDYTLSRSYLEAVSQWSSTFNSRFSQGVLLPGIINMLAGDQPGTFNWILYHGLGVAGILLTLYFFYRLLDVVGVPGRIAGLACLLFALYPAKAATLFWPATIAAYVLPTMVFTGATWWYLRLVRDGGVGLVRGLALSGLYLFSLFSIEQLAPLFVLVAAIRLVLFRPKRSALWSEGCAGLAIVLIFVLATVAGGTSQRLGKHMTDVIHPFEPLREAGYTLLTYVPRFLLDRYYRGNVADALAMPEFVGSLLLLVLVCIWMYQRAYAIPASRTGVLSHTKIVGAGLLIGFAPLTPFMIIAYGVPVRALYIPLLGLTLAAAALLDAVLLKMAGWGRAGVLACMVLVGVAAIVVGLSAEVSFRNQWYLAQGIMSEVKELRGGLHQGDRIVLVNLPPEFEMSPGLRNEFAFNGMVRWLNPGRDVTGTTTLSLSEVFCVDYYSEQMQAKLVSQASDHVIFIRGNEALRVQKITILQDAAMLNEVPMQRDVSPWVARLIPVNQQVRYGINQYVRVDGLLLLPKLDTAVLSMSVKAPLELRQRILVSAYDAADTHSVYDTAIYRTSGGDDWHRVDIFVPHFRQVRKLNIGYAVPGLRRSSPVSSVLVQIPDADIEGFQALQLHME